MAFKHQSVSQPLICIQQNRKQESNGSISHISGTGFTKLAELSQSLIDVETSDVVVTYLR